MILKSRKLENAREKFGNLEMEDEWLTRPLGNTKNFIPNSVQHEFFSAYKC